MAFKILTIIGARPQIIKAAALSRAIREHYSQQIKEVIVHTGQHYDENMSEVFFGEMQIPRPDYNLDVRSGSHGKQTGAMIHGIEEILQKEQPGCLLVYGDTNSTLAAAVAAVKMHIHVVHVEAGLRSFNKKMPEEINRILCDHVSTLLFSPTDSGIENLQKEGFKTIGSNYSGAKPSSDHPLIYKCGDVMYDNSLFFAKVAEEKTDVMKRHSLNANDFLLATIHRDYNTDHPERLSAIFSAMHEIATNEQIRMVVPLHPRTNKLLEKNLDQQVYTDIQSNKNMLIIPPVSFLEMTALEMNARMILTDSGGVQKESFFFQKPCIILRSETEWIELVNNGNAIIADADKSKIISAFSHFKNKKDFTYPSFYGNGKAARFICSEILKHLS